MINKIVTDDVKFDIFGMSLKKFIFKFRNRSKLYLYVSFKV